MAPKIGPEIPFPAEKAFYPIYKDLKGVYYSWRTCTKKFLFVCTKWEIRQAHFKFDNQEQMTWFKSNDFGLCKRPSP